MIESGRMWKGVAAGAASGALWGLVFLTPELAGMFSPLRRLAPSLMPGIAGIACVGWEALASPVAAAGRPSAPLGFLCALGALVSWTAYAVGNSRCLARLPGLSGLDWNLLTGTVTGALSLLLVPAAFFGKQKTHSPAEWGLFAGVAFGVALFSSVIGNAFWNKASRLLPLTLVGSMILFETIFALLYAFIWESRGPGIYETVAMILIGGSVLISVRAHRHPPVILEEETTHP